MEDRPFGQNKIIPKKVIASCGSFNHKFVGSHKHFQDFHKVFMLLTKSMLSIHRSHHIIGKQTNELLSMQILMMYLILTIDESS
jgi:hypothetical protein